MNTTLRNIINGIATSAKNASDAATIAVCQQFIRMAEELPSAYDSASSVASPLVIKFPQANAVDPDTSADSINGLGIAHNIGA